MHALIQPNHCDLLRHHVGDHIGRDTLCTVGPPLEKVSVVEVGDPDWTVFIVDLSGGGIHLKLADQVGQLAQFPVGQHIG